MIFAILMYALLNWIFTLFRGYEYLFENFFFTLMIRLLLLPLIAGLSFELLRGLAVLPDNKFTNALRAPGWRCKSCLRVFPTTVWRKLR